MQGISAKLPLSLDPTDGTYALNKSTISAIQQNLKMLLLTNPGERIMDVNYGVGIKRYIFSQDINDVRDEISSKINEQIRKYMNFLVIKELNFSKPNSNSDNALYIEILYYVPAINASQQLILDLSSN